jgi:hypothetical protein
LGAYVGEVILRHFGGQWEADDDDAEGEITLRVILASGTMVCPVQRVMKGFRNGSEDGLYAYGKLAGG